MFKTVRFCFRSPKMFFPILSDDRGEKEGTVRDIRSDMLEKLWFLSKGKVMLWFWQTLVVDGDQLGRRLLQVDLLLGEKNITI